MSAVRNDDYRTFRQAEKIERIIRTSREELEYLYYYLCKIMFKGAENPELTIGEIIKLV